MILVVCVRKEYDLVQGVGGRVGGGCGMRNIHIYIYSDMYFRAAAFGYYHDFFKANPNTFQITTNIF